MAASWLGSVMRSTSLADTARMRFRSVRVNSFRAWARSGARHSTTRPGIKPAMSSPEGAEPGSLSLQPCQVLLEALAGPPANSADSGGNSPIPIRRSNRAWATYHLWAASSRRALQSSARRRLWIGLDAYNSLPVALAQNMRQARGNGMIDFPIIDSHIHLLDRKRFGYAWANGAPALKRDWTPDDLAASAKPYNIEGFVFVEVDVDMPQYLDEAEWVDALAKSDGRVRGAVACL